MARPHGSLMASTKIPFPVYALLLPNKLTTSGTAPVGPSSGLKKQQCTSS